MNTQHIPTGQYALVNGLKMYYEIHGRERREMIFATELIGKHLKIDLKPPQGDFLRSPPDSKITPPTCGRVARPQNEQSQYTTICTVL
jgi:hypothetical protein